MRPSERGTYAACRRTGEITEDPANSKRQKTSRRKTQEKMMAAVMTTIGFLALGLVLWAGFKIQELRLQDEDRGNGHDEEEDDAEATLEAQRIAQEAFRDNLP